MSTDTITAETLQNLRAVKRGDPVPHPDAPLNSALCEMTTDFEVGKSIWRLTSIGEEVVNLADELARIIGKALWFDDSADYGSALWETLGRIDPTLADMIENDSDEAEGVLYPKDAE